MSSAFGHILKVTVFGESHGPAIGAVLDGLPAGEAVNLAAVTRFLARRAPGQGMWSTARKEPDTFEVLSGLKDGVTCGTPLAAICRNQDTRSQDYAAMRKVPRPGHADFTAELRYHGFQDRAGGGHFSGRLTAPLAFAGAVALQILSRRGVAIGAHLAEVAGISDRRFDPVNVDKVELASVGVKVFPVLDDAAGEAMQNAIRQTAKANDSVGGIVECAAVGFPGGIGNPMFDGLENRLAQALFGIPAVRGLEFGTGFAASELHGSEHNDAFTVADGRIWTATNHHGGILGGISSGMPIVFRLAFKPTPSIAFPQRSVDLETMQETELAIRGRHDPCIAPRAVPVVEAVTALVLLDALLERKGA